MVIAYTTVELAQIKKLLHAVQTSNYDQVRRICQKGVYGIVNSNDPTDGETPLLIAVKRNDEMMIQFLLDLGAHPDRTDFKVLDDRFEFSAKILSSLGRTPLMRAAEHGFIEAVQTLLNANAKTNIRDLEGKDVLFACLSDDTYRQQECFSIIMSRQMPDINELTKTGKPLLIAACEKGIATEKICLMLIERGVNINTIEKTTGRTALHAACASGSIKIVRELLRRKVNVNACDNQQQTPAHAAITSKIFELLPILSAYNARFDLADQSLNTSVHLAARLNQERNLLDLATDFASPQVFNLVRTAYEGKGNKKNNQQFKVRRKSNTNTKKNKKVELLSTSIKPVKIEAPLPRRGSLIFAEEQMKSSNDVFESITYHPLAKWTDQPTTRELLDKKINLRNQFTSNIDFPDYKRPLFTNAEMKLEHLKTSTTRSNSKP
ncbi:hypothetical protein I4U23_029008 [Adineta vaga]|nr:hypothetical protein I4U23_029008 [Adineta vaga]